VILAAFCGLPFACAAVVPCCHCLPLCCCLPAGTMYDLKQSKYKKLGKLLDKFEKDKVGRCC
jgi:hypothetical protein